MAHARHASKTQHGNEQSRAPACQSLPHRARTVPALIVRAIANNLDGVRKTGISHKTHRPQDSVAGPGLPVQILLRVCHIPANWRQALGSGGCALRKVNLLIDLGRKKGATQAKYSEVTPVKCEKQSCCPPPKLPRPADLKPPHSC